MNRIRIFISRKNITDAIYICGLQINSDLSTTVVGNETERKYSLKKSVKNRLSRAFGMALLTWWIVIHLHIPYGFL